MMRTGGDQFSLPEIHRVKATLLLARSAADRDTAEAAFGEAIDVARGQQARLLELRAATSLARLWGDKAAAAPPVNCSLPSTAFTEGFDTLDLKEAKALLGELAT